MEIPLQGGVQRLDSRKTLIGTEYFYNNMKSIVGTTYELLIENDNHYYDIPEIFSKYLDLFI